MKLFTIAISILLGHAVLADIDQIAHENKTKFAQIQECINKVNKGSEVWRNSNQMSSDLVYSLNDLIHIDLQVQLRYQHYFTQDELSQAIPLMEKARVGIEEFYASQGLRLHLTFHHAAYDSTSLAGHPQPPERAHVVYIRRNTGEHMKSIYWGVNFDWTETDRAAIYSHETSHLLGLKDEYETRLAERIGEEDNIMKNWDAKGAKFYPHQIQQLIAPLCD